MKETSETSSLFERQARWREKNPLARWAHVALASAVRRGLVEKGVCKICGSEQVDAHHTDYTQPLLVEFYCRLHHKAEHKRLKQEANS
ncbi:hypothetical protein EON80_30260 [bacterium]|nr:MAG: hypothetical protein EON80_30260 [bacterium]